MIHDFRKCTHTQMFTSNIHLNPEKWNDSKIFNFMVEKSVYWLTKQKWNMILHKWALICFNLLFLYCAMYFSLILQFPKTHASNIHSLGVKREYLQFYTFLGIIIDLKLILINCKKLRVKKTNPYSIICHICTLIKPPWVYCIMLLLGLLCPFPQCHIYL